MRSLYIFLLFLLVVSGQKAWSQANASINLLTQNAGVVTQGGEVYIQVDVANSGPVSSIGVNKVRAQISVPPIVQIVANAQQNGLPTGWTILTNTGTAIMVCNGTNVIPVNQVRTVLIKVRGVTLSGPLTVAGVLSFGPGTGVCTGPGALPGDITADNTSTSSISVVPAASCPLGVSVSSGTIVCNGGTTSVTATVTGAAGPIEYSLNNGTFQSSNVFSVPAGTHTITAREVNTPGCSASTSVTVTQPAVVAAPVPDNVIQPTCNLATGSVELINLPAGSWTIMPGNITGNTPTRVVSGLPTGVVSFTVTNADGCTSAASAPVVIDAQPETPSISASGVTTFCAGGNVVLTSSAAVGNQWFRNGTALTGATATTLNVTQSGNYTVVANGCSSPTTAVTVNATPATPTISASGATTFCAGGSVVLTSSAASGNQWFRNGTALTGATATTLNVTESGNYTVVATSGGCPSAASTATAVTVNAIPVTPTISASGATTFCAGGSVVLTSSAASGNQWFRNGTALTGATATTLNVTESGNYTVVATSGGCPSAASTATAVTVNAIPVTPTISASGATTFCAGGSVVLTSSAASGNQWFRNGTALTGATSANFTATESGNYTVVTTANACPSAASTATAVTVNTIPVTPTISASGATTFCAGGSVVLTSSAASGNQWFRNGTALTGATATTLNVTESGNYTVVATSGGCPSAASTATAVTVTAAPATPTISQAGNTLQSSAPTGNRWFLNGVLQPALTTQTITPIQSGLYSVQVTLGNCVSQMSASLNFVVTSVTTTAFERGIIVAPNPVVQMLQIRSLNYLGALNVRILTHSGAEVRKAIRFTSSCTIDMGNLAAGVYLVEVVNERTKEVAKKKVIKL